jgi:uncharacterized phage protein (TIGR02218 family)
MIALLATGGPFLMADLYTLTLKGGTVYRWTSADTPLTVGANTWTCPADTGAGCPLIHRGSIRNARGLEVQTTDLTLYCANQPSIGGVSVQRFSLNGGFDGATVRVERAMMATWGDTSAGTVMLFEGSVAGVDPSSTQVILHLKSELEKLQIQMPRITYQPYCNNWIGDAACGVALASWTDACTATGTPTTTALTGTPAHADGYYSNGVIAFTTGANAGARRAVASYLSGVLVPSIPFPSAPAPGDQFTVFPGCDRTTGAGGCTRFSNLNRYRGTPFVPVPETSV